MEAQIEKEAYTDSLKAFGEEGCARELAKALDAEYIDPKDIFLVTEKYGNAKILPESEELIKEIVLIRLVLF